MSVSDSLKELGRTVARYGAPLLGTVIGGPAGAVIGQMVASQFGGDADDPADLMYKIVADPNAAVKLAEIQNNSKVELSRIAMQMAENDLKYETQKIDLSNQNTKSARDSNALTKSLMPQIISVIIMLGFFLSIWLVASLHQEEQDQQILYMLLGTMASAFGAVINYWLGSSAGSHSKDIALLNSVPAPNIDIQALAKLKEEINQLKMKHIR